MQFISDTKPTLNLVNLVKPTGSVPPGVCAGRPAPASLHHCSTSKQTWVRSHSDACFRAALASPEVVVRASGSKTFRWTRNPVHQRFAYRKYATHFEDTRFLGRLSLI